MSSERTKGPVELGDEAALAAATWLNGPEYLGAKAALLACARKIDAWDVVVLAAVEWAEEASGRRPRVPMHDSTSLGTHTRLLAELGLTAASRAKLERAGEFMQGGGAKPSDDDTKMDGGPGEQQDDVPVGEQPVGKLARIDSLRDRVRSSG